MKATDVRVVTIPKKDGTTVDKCVVKCDATAKWHVLVTKMSADEAFDKVMKLEGITGTRYMYHDPCHSPMKTYAPLKVTNALMGQDVALNDRCCGESGTFAVSRPDIATQVKMRKQEELEKGMVKLGLTPGAPEQEVKILTSCPSCLQGLSRYGEDTGVKSDYIVVEMAKHLLGEDWMQQYVEKANNGGIEKVLL
jgi:Fe-S oxidoreductase